MSSPVNSEFDFKGVNHIALVCRDMAATVEFYRDVLGMPLLKTLDLPRGRGQHFFFDIGNGDSLAFFWFPDAPKAEPGISAPAAMPGQGSFVTAHGSMNHLAINVSEDRFEEYHAKLVAKGIKVTPIVNHDHSETQVSATLNDDVYVRSLYFFDPNGVLLEFAAWRRDLGRAEDIAHEPVTETGETRAEPLVIRDRVPA